MLFQTLLTPAFAAVFLAFAGGAYAVPLQPLIDAAEDGQVVLDGSTVYTGQAFVGESVAIAGNGARLDLPAGGTVTVAGGAELEMESLTIRGGTAGISFLEGGHGTLRNVRVEQTGWGISTSSSAEVRLRGVEIDGAQNSGIVVHEGGSLDAEGLTVEGGENGLQMHRGRAAVRGGTFRDLTNGFSYSGRLELVDVTIENLTGQAINANVSAEPAPVHPLLLADNLTVRNCGQGVFVTRGLYDVRNSHFEGLPHGIYSTGQNGEELERSAVRGSRFEAIAEAAVQHNEEGELLVEDSEFHFCYGGISMIGASRLEARRVFLNSAPHEAPGVGIALRFGAELLLEDAQIYGHLNSVDAYGDCTMTLRDSRFVEPYFSGIIARDNTEIDVRGCNVIDNGQDGIFSDGQDEVRPGRGTIVGNRIVRAGIGEVYLPVGRDEQAGTGIAVKGGQWTIEGNTIGGSYDVGIAVQAHADAVMRNNVVYDSRLSGILLENPHPAQRVHDGNVVTGHRNEGQVGILVIGGAGQPVFRRTVLAQNRTGVRLLSAGSTVRFEDSAILLSDNFGVDALQGSAALVRTVIGNNADWGIIIGPQFSSMSFEECDIVTATGRGVHNSAAAVFPANGLYWSPGANHNRLQVSTTAPLPHRDVAYGGRAGHAELSFASTRMGAPWFLVSGAALGQSGSFVYTMRLPAYYGGVDIPGWGMSVPGGVVEVMAFRPSIPLGVPAVWEVLLPGAAPEQGALVLAERDGGFVPFAYALAEGADRLRAVAALEDFSGWRGPVTLGLVPGAGIPETRRLLGLPEEPAGYTEEMNRIMDTNLDGAIDAGDIVRRLGAGL